MHISFRQQVYKLGIWRDVRTCHSEPVRFPGVGISIEFRAAYRHTGRSILPFSGVHPREMVLLSRRLPRQCEHWLAMTGKSALRHRPTERYRAGQGRNDHRPRSSRLGCRPCRQIPICPVLSAPKNSRNLREMRKNLPNRFGSGDSARLCFPDTAGWKIVSSACFRR